MHHPSARIAIVDDDPSVRSAVGRLLRAAGYQPACYASAREYLASGTGTDCLVLDVQLEGATGFDLQERLRAAGDAVPIVFITARHEVTCEELEMRAGCDGWLRKPFDGEALIAAIQRRLGRGGRAGGRASGQTNTPPA